MLVPKISERTPDARSDKHPNRFLAPIHVDCDFVDVLWIHDIEKDTKWVQRNRFSEKTLLQFYGSAQKRTTVESWSQRAVWF